MGSQRVGQDWVPFHFTPALAGRFFFFFYHWATREACSSVMHINYSTTTTSFWASLVAQTVKSVCNAGDQGSILGLGSSPGEENGNPLQYSCLENPMARDWWASQSMGSQRVEHDWETNTYDLLLLLFQKKNHSLC